MARPDPAADPAAAIQLRNGGRVPVRPIRPEDADRLREFHDHLSRQTIYYRFFGAMPHLSEVLARRFAEVDYVNRYALVAIDPEDPDTIVGVARFDRVEETDRAELAIVLTDRFHGQGLGRAMLELLIEAARSRGIREMFAVVLAENVRMITLLRHLGYPHREHWEHGVERLTLDITAGGRVDAAPPAATGADG